MTITFNNGGVGTATVTDTLVETISECTATTTDYSTLTVDGPTVTADTCTNTGGNSGGSGGLDYGTCSDPTIRYEYGLDGRTEYAYTTNNQADFPFGSSPIIDIAADLICNRLRSPCNAPQSTIDRCYEAEDAVANLTGQEAADVWNDIMG